MHGVPVDIPLQLFVGCELNQICIGSFQVQFHCSGTGSISVEGRWELRDISGALVDTAQEHNERESYKLHRILDVPITRFTVDPPLSFTLFFESGFSLTVFDDPEQYESFSLHRNGQPSIYV